jgi:carbonic anhydrase
MAAAIVLTCVDPRLSHDVIRDQVHRRLERDGLQAGDIYLVNEIGGNLGSGVLNTLDLLTAAKVPVVLAAVLHHDDCLAARLNLRKPLAATAAEIAAELSKRGLKCPVLTGNVTTDSNGLTWTDLPPVSHEVFKFRMPRMMGH